MARRTTTPDDRQCSLEALLLDGDRANHAYRMEKQSGHLPATMAEALPFFREMIAQHHAAMLRGNPEAVMRCREEAQLLAVRLNGGAPGYLAGPDAPGCVLTRETAAAADTVPLWGQAGSFVVTVAGTRVRIRLSGIFGICMAWSYWPGFDAHAVDWDRPFISETGYRSFLGIHAAPAPDITPEHFAAEVIAAHVRKEMKGRLVMIEERYRKAG